MYYRQTSCRRGSRGSQPSMRIRRRRGSLKRGRRHLDRLMTTLAPVMAMMLVLLGFAAQEVASQASWTGARPLRTNSTPATPAAGNQPLEGRDYSFIGKVNGRPVRWPCGHPIGVVVLDPAPAGSRKVVDDVVAELQMQAGSTSRVGSTLCSPLFPSATCPGVPPMDTCRSMVIGWG